MVSVARTGWDRRSMDHLPKMVTSVAHGSPCTWSGFKPDNPRNQPILNHSSNPCMGWFESGFNRITRSKLNVLERVRLRTAPRQHQRPRDHGRARPDMSRNNENNASSSPHGRLDDNDEPHAPEEREHDAAWSSIRRRGRRASLHWPYLIRLL